jgi:methyl-accepting chemotaxis protein
MSIQRKFIYVIFAVIVLFTLILAAQTSTVTKDQINQTIQIQVDDKSTRLLNILDVTNSLVLERVKSSMRLLMERGKATGTPNQGEMITVKGTPARQLFLGDKPQANDFTMVDNLTAIMNGTATLFSKTGEDYIRVSTNVIKDGNRAIGTKLAPKGRAIAKIRQGEAYYGAVDILGNPYLTGYEPMFDANNSVIGIWYVGYSADLKLLEETITNSSILEEGFVALRDGKGSIRMHSSHVTDEDIERAINSNNSDWDITVIPYPAWGYDIILAQSVSEINALVTKSVIAQLIKIIIPSALILGVLVFLVKTLVGRPLNEFIAVIGDIASGEGDLTFRFDEKRKDEFGLMAKGFNQLLQQLQQTLRAINDSNEIMLKQSQALEVIANEASQTVQSLNDETDGISHAIEELEKNAQTVAKNTNVASEAADTADQDTRNIVDVLNEIINDIKNQASDLDTSVEVINELAKSSEEINGVMEVISNIADQTNLLALNAAIEAARAGDQGRGFAVVADEVRSLASRTQKSTVEIHNMIDRLQSGSRKASTKVQSNKKNAFNSVEVAQKAGKSLENSLASVETITKLNSKNVEIANGQLDLTTEVSQRVSSIKSVADDNLKHANTVATNCEELVQQLAGMQQQLKHYRF